MNFAPPRKRFGQHFLRDQNILAKIVSAIDPRPDDHLVEIGPGQGALTAPLLTRAGRVDAIELDRDLAAALPALLASPKLQVHQGDALKFDFSTLGKGNLRLVGNLPYNISTPLLFHFLDSGHLFRDLHVMLQKEVVDRMVAEPGNKIYGRLTVALAARARVDRLFVIRPGSFVPPPKVDSAFVRIVPDPLARQTIRSEPVFDRVLAAAFSQRRKQLGSSLRGLIAASGLQALNIDPARRPETLTAGDFVRIANDCAGRDGIE